MIDAYTIGVTLALDDGVSVGVAAIAKDLAVLDRAIDASMVRVAELRRAADDVVGVARRSPPTRAVMGPVPPAITGTALDAGQTIHTAPRETPVRPTSPAPRIAGGAAPAALPPPLRNATDRVPTPMPRPGSSVAPPVVVTTHIAPPAPVAPVVVEPPAATQATPAPQRAAAEPVVPIVHIVQPNVPPPFFPLPAPQAPVVLAPRLEPPPSPAAPIAPRPESPMAPPAVELSAFARKAMLPVAGSTAKPLEAPPSPPVPPQVRLAHNHSAPVSPPRMPDEPMPQARSRSIEAEGSGRAAAPRVLEQHVLYVPVVAPAMPRPAAPPAAMPTAHGPGGGDVFLDGVRVGHWLSRHLDATAMRPPIGTTGFDPRLSPSWAGATVSN